MLSSTYTFGTFTSTATPSGGTAWTNPKNAQKSDGLYATSAIDSTVAPSISEFLWCDSKSSSPTIPNNCRITGIVVNIERNGTQISRRGVIDNIVQLVKAGSRVGSNKASSAVWPTSDAVASYGSNIDLWGTTWTGADVNNARFGVALSAKLSLGALGVFTASVDYVYMTIYYRHQHLPLLGVT